MVIVCPGGAYATCDRHSAEGDPVADFVEQERFRKEKDNPAFSTINMNYAWFGQEESVFTV